MDIRRAFLQGNSFEREIFIKPPKEADCQGIWRLNKCVYGLNEASRSWYNRVHDEFLNMRLTRSKYDNVMFFYKPNKNGQCEGIIVIHADDSLYGGSSHFEKVTNEVHRKFIVGSDCDVPSKYVGIDINMDRVSLAINQQSYIDGIKETSITNQKDKSKALNEFEQSQFRAICGQLNWVASQSHPDLSFEVCRLSTSLNKATIGDLLHAKKTVQKCKQRSVCLKFPQLQKPFHLVAFCDASYANLKERSSQGGVIMFLKGKGGKIAPISWSSRKIRRVCQSTLAAETMALLEASETCCWISHIINELLKTPLETTEIFTDNKSFYETAHSTAAVEEKRLRVNIAAIRQIISKK